MRFLMLSPVRYFVGSILLLLFVSCNQQKKIKHDPAAAALVNQTTYLALYSDNEDIARKALKLLDSATSIDSTNIIAYRNKLMYLGTLKEYDKIISALKSMMRIQPNGIDIYIYMLAGLFYEKLNDSISARPYFEKPFSISKNVLDTMSPVNVSYLSISSTQAINLIMLGRHDEVKALFEKIYNTEPNKNFRELIQVYSNKNKKELIELLTSISDSALKNDR